MISHRGNKDPDTPYKAATDKPGPETLISEALDSLRLARGFLLDPTPQNVDYSQMAMGQCAARLASLIADPAITAGVSRNLIDSIGNARSELNNITLLLTTAASYRRGLWQTMQAAAGPSVSAGETRSETEQRVQVLC